MRIRLFFLCVKFVAIFTLISCGAENESPNELTNVDPIDAVTVDVNYPIDIKTSVLSGSFKINGDYYENEMFSDAHLDLIGGTDEDDELTLLKYSDYQYNKRLIHGDYQLKYYHVFGDATPSNYRELVQNFSITDDMVLDIEIETIDASFVFTMNGEELPNGVSELAEWYLRLSQSEEMIYLGSTQSSELKAAVMPGEYEIIYQYISGDELPKNNHAILQKIILDTSETIQIDITTVSIISAPKLNGQSMIFSPSENANLFFVNEETGDAVKINEDFTSLHVTNLISGSYQVEYEYEYVAGEDLPKNRNYVFSEKYTFDENARIEINIPMINISGIVLLNGEAPPNSAVDYAHIYIKPIKYDDYIFVAETFWTGFDQLKLIPDSYIAVYDMIESTSLIPKNKMTSFGEVLLLEKNQTIEIDIPSVDIDLKLTVNGSPFEVQANNYGYIYLHNNNNSEYKMLIGETFYVDITERVLAGNYSFTYKNIETVGYPRNQNYIFIQDYDIHENEIINYDFNMVSFRLELTLNGAKIPLVANGYGRIYLGTNKEDIFLSAETFNTSEPRNLFEGTYKVYYESIETGVNVPHNKMAVIGEVLVE